MRLNLHQLICKYWEKLNRCRATTFGAHSTWEEEDWGTQRWGREPHAESASGQPSERVGDTYGLWSPFRWHQSLPYLHFQPSRPLELSCDSSLPLWGQLKAALYFGLHSESIPLLPQCPPHTIWLISTLPLFSCVCLTQHFWIWLFLCSAAVW